MKKVNEDVNKVKLWVITHVGDSEISILDDENDFYVWMEDGSINVGDIVYEIYSYVEREVIQKLELE